MVGTCLDCSVVWVIAGSRLCILKTDLSNILLHISLSYAYMLVMSHSFGENSFFNNVFRDLCNVVFVYLFECAYNGVMYSENKVSHCTQ